MTQEQSTTKEKKFQQLTREKQAQIEILLRQGYQKAQITKVMGISRSTLYDELKQGTVGQRVYEERRHNNQPPMKLTYTYNFVRYAEQQILEYKLSPDAICGKAKLSGRFEIIVNDKILYNYIDKRLLNVRSIDLQLQVKRKNQNKRIFRASIEERPEEINNRIEFGHWGIDIMVDKKEFFPVLLILEERLTRERHLVKIPSRSSEAVRIGLEKIAKSYGKSFETVFKSVTSDNGSEFVDLGKHLPKSTKVYYAHPYSSYERGTNEKQNSLIHRFFSKCRYFDAVSDE